MLPSTDRWKRLEMLFYQCLELPAEERSAWLAESCSDDTELRREIEGLLEEAAAPMDFLKQPVFEAARTVLAEPARDELAPGTTLNRYQIISLLATGGMGQVYLAKDTQLKRQVVLKILKPTFPKDETGLRRFEREAHAASALNHPNILTIHEFCKLDGLHFIASEYVEGVTLRKKLSNGPLDLNTTVNISIQIASALDVAHAAGIIHRDIKPENVMVRNDGLVKILDFGIAKLMPRQLTAGAAVPSASTKPGILMGTAAYMSPEQAKGEALDARTDLFSFGIVLYEMTTGALPFPGDNAGMMLEKILMRKPTAPILLNAAVPANLDSIINKALEKDRSRRYQRASDIRSDLQRLQQSAGASGFWRTLLRRVGWPRQ